MTSLRIPAATVRVTVEDATVDLVCFQHLMTVLRDRAAVARVTGYVEATLKANPGLSALGLILPFRTVVALPEYVVEPKTPATRRLWDTKQ